VTTSEVVAAPSDLSVLHPVARVIWQRHAEGSVPGARRDSYRLGLAIEGGGIRGVVSGGMLVALEEMGLRDTVDVVYGASAGAFNATYFLAGQTSEALSLYYDEMTATNFLDPRRLLRRQPAVSVEWIIEVVMEQLAPLDWAGVLSSPIKLNVIASCLADMRPVAFSDLDSIDELKQALLASARIPFLAGPPVAFRGRRLLDAAVLLAHPFSVAVDDGCTHVLSLSTRPRGRIRTLPNVWDRMNAWRLDRLRPGLGAGYLQRTRDYGRSQRLLADFTADFAKLPSVLDAAPPGDFITVRQLERNVARILSGARAGYEAAILALTGRHVRAIYRVTAADRFSGDA
jgi:predicted patatin/cPLA2 family phospholipase